MPPPPQAPVGIRDPQADIDRTLLPDILARVGDWPITRDMVWPTISSRINRIIAAGDRIPPARLRFILRPVVNDIIDEKLLGERAAAAGFVPDLERARTHLQALSSNPARRGELERLLQDANMTAEQYIARLALRTAITDWVRRTFVDPVEASPEEVASLYQKRQQELTVPVSIWLERIVVNAAGDPGTRAAARAAAVASRARIAAGLPFSTAAAPAAETPPPPGSGVFSQARVQENQLPPPVLTALQSLEAGEISPVVELPDAFALLRWQDRHASRQPSLGEVTAGLELNLKEDKGRERFAAYLDALKREAGVVLYPPLDQPPQGPQGPPSQGLIVPP